MADAPDDFTKFFDELSQLKQGETPPATFGQTDPAAAAVTPPVETPVVTDTPATDTPTGKAPATGDGGVTPPVETPVVAPVETPAVTPPKVEDTDLLTRLADILDKRQPVVQQVQPQPVAPPPLYTDDEAGRLAKFREDWPDIFDAFVLMARGNAVQNNAFVFQEVAKAVGPQLQNLQTVQTDHHYMALKTAIPDYDQVRDSVVKWAREDRTIPGYLRTAYDGVIQGGDVGEISDLVDRWRQATGTAKPTTVPAVPAKPEIGLSQAAKQAAEALAPVSSKRTANVPSEPTDYDTAFAAFAKA